MSDPTQLLPMYLHLARAAELRRRPLVRDKMLVLAGAAAQSLDLDTIAAACRFRILSHNPGHMLRRFPTMASALESERFQMLYASLARRFPPEKAEHMLQSLGIQWSGERATYYSDEEYAAALLGMRGSEGAATSPHAAEPDATSGSSAESSREFGEDFDNRADDDASDAALEGPLPGSLAVQHFTAVVWWTIGAVAGIAFLIGVAVGWIVKR